MYRLSFIFIILVLIHLGASIRCDHNHNHVDDHSHNHHRRRPHRHHSPCPHSHDRMERQLRGIANMVSEADRRASQHCSEELKVKEHYGEEYYLVIKSDFKEADFEAKIKYRVLMITARNENATATGIRILPDIVDVKKASKDYAAPYFVINMPYKTVLKAAELTCTVSQPDHDDEAISVPKLSVKKPVSYENMFKDSISENVV